MRIFVLTPIYATTTTEHGVTPVVHYFAREWVKMGHEVTVFNIVAKYPKLFYWIGRHFQHQLNSRLGMLIPVESPKDDDINAEGVVVHRRCFKKIKPHSLYSSNARRQIIKCIVDECDKLGVPDWFVGHWDNPQLEILSNLKGLYGKPTCLVFHDNTFDIEGKYGLKGMKLLKSIDVIGFRSKVAQTNYFHKYGLPKRSFVASSGVSNQFLKTGNSLQRIVKQPLKNFVFVGSLINRKHPLAVLKSLVQAYPDGDFRLVYIGDGAERSVIEEEYKLLGNKGELVFTGRIPREEIISYLQKSDVFVMISEGEIFGLVYLEAMSFGLITVGSKKEGIDGVIRDGENGFLCEAGNDQELTKVLTQIKTMTEAQLEEMSAKAKETANEFSDVAVAKSYLSNLQL